MNREIKKYFIAPVLSIMVLSTAVCGSFASAAAAKDVNGNSAKGFYYTTDYESKEEVIAASNELNEEICGEGFTLLKNEDNALPLAHGAKISLFGKNSIDVLSGGSGAGGGSGGTPVSIQTALRNDGFDLNPSLINFYNDNAASGNGRGLAPTNGNISAGYNTGETPIENYTDELESSYAEYNDAAIVVITRVAGEGFDLPRTMKWDGESYGRWTSESTQLVPGARSVDDHYLQLDQNETDLIKYCGDRFDKVIVLLNCGSQFETGFLDDPGHYAYHENTKAALWIGYPGETGLNILGDVLKGTVNPSGRTTDTWARDFKANPTWQNFGNYLTPDGNVYSNFNEPYIYYQEGIYSGYRYYETRGEEEGLDKWTVGSDPSNYADYLHGTTTKTWDNWYDGHVVYPLGHGLSYTTFSQEILSADPADGSALAKDGTITIQVKVTNTGSVAGKEVVQLYYTAPYIEGEVEKSHVVLAAFDKTRLLQPQESETLTLSFKVREMASYDWSDANKNGSAVYEMDEGAYTVRLMRDAHNEIDSVDYTAEEDFIYDTDSKTGNEVKNLFDDISKETGETLSRADFAGTFPEMNVKVAADQWIIDRATEWKTPASYVPDTPDKPYYTEDMPTTGNDTGDIMLSDLMGKDYVDPMWGEFMDQLSVSTMQNMVGNAT